MTSRARDSPLEKVGVLNGFEQELRLWLLVEQKVHDVDLKVRLKLRAFDRKSAIRVFAYQKN